MGEYYSKHDQPTADKETQRPSTGHPMLLSSEGTPLAFDSLVSLPRQIPHPRLPTPPEGGSLWGGGSVLLPGMSHRAVWAAPPSPVLGP